MKSADDSHTEMLVIDLPTTAFTDYGITEDGVICLDISQLKTMIGSAKDIIKFEQDVETKKLKISFGKTRYTTSLIDPTSIKSLPRLPDLTFAVSTEIPYSDLSEAISALKGISGKGDEFNISTSKNKILFQFSDKMSSVETEVSADDLPEASAKYTIEYLDLISKILKNCKEIKLEFGTDYPMRISAKLGEVSIVWLIAPRLEVD